MHNKMQSKLSQKNIKKPMQIYSDILQFLKGPVEMSTLSSYSQCTSIHVQSLRARREPLHTWLRFAIHKLFETALLFVYEKQSVWNSFLSRTVHLFDGISWFFVEQKDLLEGLWKCNFLLKSLLGNSRQCSFKNRVQYITAESLCHLLKVPIDMYGWSE